MSEITDPNLQTSASPKRQRTIVVDEKLEPLARLSGGMAHDFNNILHVLKTVSDLLRSKLGNGDAETVRLIEMVDRNVGRGISLTRELLAIAGRQALSPSVLNASQLIADMQDRLRQALGGTPLDLALAGSLWPVDVDAKELQTAIMNLALNARDAAPGRKISIETRNATLSEDGEAGQGAPPGDYVSISVCDSGPGMTAETLARAFEPYYTTKDAGHPMTGLGLSRVCGFVRQSGGHVTVESAPGAGTSVTINLPRFSKAPTAEGRRGEAVAKVRSAAVPGRATTGLAGLRVLVVEDESLLGMLVEDLLEQLGCRMVGLFSGLEQALEAAKSAEFDLALLDVDIGGEPVYPVAEALRARGVPFLFMSGYGGLEGPWRDCPIVQKPFDLAQLEAGMQRAARES